MTRVVVGPMLSARTYAWFTALFASVFLCFVVTASALPVSQQLAEDDERVEVHAKVKHAVVREQARPVPPKARTFAVVARSAAPVARLAASTPACASLANPLLLSVRRLI